MADIKADATSYILTMLLQRFEAQNPGALNEMIEGVKSDQASVSSNASGGEHVAQVFKEALSFLTKAKSLSSDAPNS
jgi:hypothetical protein